jgi:hypothetical protein
MLPLPSLEMATPWLSKNGGKSGSLWPDWVPPRSPRLPPAAPPASYTAAPTAFPMPIMLKPTTRKISRAREHSLLYRNAC